jgi:hypothetical protein
LGLPNLDEILAETRQTAESSPTPLREDQADRRSESAEYNSIHNFPSPHPAKTDGTEKKDEAPISSQKFTVGRLYDQLLGNFHKYSTEDYLEHLSRHIEEEGDNHYKLSEVFNNRAFPSILKSHSFLTADQLARQNTPTPT